MGLYAAIGFLAALLLMVILVVLVVIIAYCRLRGTVQDSHKDVKGVVQDSGNAMIERMDKMLTEIIELRQQLEAMECNAATYRTQGDGGEAYEMQEPAKDLIEFDQRFAAFIVESCSMALKNPRIRDQVQGSVGGAMKELLLDS